MADFISTVKIKRKQADILSKKINLSQTLSIPEAKFRTLLRINGLAPFPLDSYMIDLIWNSNLVFNNLYSKYSSDHFDPVAKMTQFKLNSNLVNLFYGPNLEVCAFF
jgi:hypothetical protein